MNKAVISWGWRILFLIIWISLIVPVINEAISPSSRGRVSEGTALFYGLIQSIVYVIGFAPLFLKYLSIKGININFNNIQIANNSNEKIHKKTRKPQQEFKKAKPKKSIKVKKQSFDQQAKSIEKFIQNYDFPQTDDEENYIYEFDYIKKDKIIFLEIEVYINNNKNKIYPVLHFEIS